MQHLFAQAHEQWHLILKNALNEMDTAYLEKLQEQTDWLPGCQNLLAAFSQSLDKLHYILLGESPYPRIKSANGYAFWDNMVEELWSAKGLSKQVNRATSLRNFIKMLLVARGDLSLDLSQAAIANLDKSNYIQTGKQLFTVMLDKGFLLLNATLVFRQNEVAIHAKKWYPFMKSILNQLFVLKPSLTILLFGRFAAQIPEVKQFNCVVAEHPYNLTFINNHDVLAFFNPLDLLSCYAK